MGKRKITRREQQDVMKQLRSMGYHPFRWGDFWNTNCSARVALKKTEGKQVSCSKTNPIVWDTRPGPLGGCWIRYSRLYAN